ncbi:NAD+ synthase [Fervidobacterium thailandense]|uniref:Glutamine-dependent NAD(+) synthetase n=1 Tax=Fervidobacterium thailandense TaxID=1008305 RepID=A0A1E3G403_9BACT|nr:NAD+ synthase [Fervidobacterium thailandense]ODN30984.1 NAD+ synthase [Fervidobacterium thailandense]
MRNIRIALAQINTTVGDIHGNERKIIDYIQRARELGADVVAFPELAITGYPPEDLLLKSYFVQRNLESLERISKHADKDIVAIVGFVDFDDDLYNAAAVLHNGRIVATYRKNYLPNYGVFDEKRYFQVGQECLVLQIRNVNVGITICEDIWYPGGPARLESLIGDAHVLINLSASPYYMGKPAWREKMLAVRANDNQCAIAYVNAIGGQDELVFDGCSLVIDEKGEILARAKQYEEDLLVADVDVEKIARTRLHDNRRRQDKLNVPETELRKVRIAKVEDFPTKPHHGVHTPSTSFKIEPLLPEVAEVYWALVLATRDYIRKNGMNKAVIGLSGGMDSSLVACIAVDALGPENVIGVSMPGPFSSEHSKEDAKLLAENLGIKFLTIPITDAYETYLKLLKPVFGDLPFDITEENLQARIRGTILMALSNKFGWLVLTTGNKSEVATGYSTLYGDTAGGYAVIKDVYKTFVYKLGRYVNEKAGREIIPERVFIKPPSAELRENQTDQDKLPPYEVLDEILKLYIEEEMSIDEIVAHGFDEETVKKVARMVHANEYKRRQMPPGPKVSVRAFGKDRRVPMTNRFDG